MNKKVIIALAVVAVVLVGAIGLVIYNHRPVQPVVNDQAGNENVEGNSDNGAAIVPIPKVITKAGFINNVGKNKVIIKGPNDEKITIYINEDTEIFGPDGSKKELSELSSGVYITVDIDGNEFEENANKFDAMTIYISGK